MATPSPVPRIGLLAIVLAVIVALSAADLLLARIEGVETRTQATHYYDTGTQLLALHRAADAIDPLRKAHAMDRHNLHFSLQLADALIQAEKFDEAQTLLDDVLERTPNDGEADLLEARLLQRRGDTIGAIAFYHRAIYGAWGGTRSASDRLIRLELANLLATNGSAKELLAELLPLETEAEDDLGTRKQVAKLFMVAGSPARAETAYRSLIHDDSDDKSNYNGLGEAELALGNYGQAQLAFRNAGAAAQAERAAEMAALDPTIRRLSSAEKFHRSMRILSMVRDAVSRCQGSSRLQELLNTANRALSVNQRGNATNELAEERLTLAEQLWQQRTSNCAPLPSSTDSLARLMQKLGSS